MNESWTIRIFENQNPKPVYEEDVSGWAELGRQNPDEKQPFSQVRKEDSTRIIIAPLAEKVISRRHIMVEPQPNGRFIIRNVSQTQPVHLGDGGRIEPNSFLETTSPVVMMLGNRQVCLEAASDEGADIQALPEMTMAPGQGKFTSPFGTVAASPGPAMQAESLVRWIQATMDVLHSAASSEDFFARAAQAMVELAGLDSGRVVLLEEGQWHEQAAFFRSRASKDGDWKPSKQVLRKVLAEKKTFWQVPTAGATSSLVGIKAVVVAPILNPQSEVIGALYGMSESATSRPITKLEAMLVEVLASGVATGLARLMHEKKALLFEQFFPSDLSRELHEHPELLEGRDCEVTVLFCDIRGFSRISERLGPAKTVTWVFDTMSALSKCVLDHGGVLVDYIGDELMAMWGAPVNTPDHASRACRAALDMLARLPQLTEHCQAMIQESLNLGIGLNTGLARVGNVGSQFKFKYGPLGNTVNLASRVQGANKYLKTRLLMTNTTQAQLSKDFSFRRLCQVRVVNIAEPVTLFELPSPDLSTWKDLKQGYEDALDNFNNKEFRQAARILGRLLPEHPQDGPSLVLMSRVIQCLVEEPDPFDPVWELPGK